MTTASPAQNEQQQSIEAQLQHLKHQLAEAQLENGRHKQRLEKLSHVILERDKKISELQRYEYSFRRLNEQRQSVDHSGDEYREQLQELQSKNERLSKELEESLQHGIQLDRVNRFLREKEQEAQLEINQFHDELNKARALIVELQKTQCTDTIQQEYEDKIYQERIAKEEAQDEVKALYSQFEVLKKMLSDAKMKSDNLQAERASAEAALEKLKQEEISRVQANLTEVESHLKIAQQHLAKKVKETSDLQDKVHSQDLLIQEVQSSLEQARQKILDQQHSFDTQLLQEKRLYEQLLESFKATESLVSKWEEKYFNIYEKWKDNEVQLKEMKKIEVKHVQLQVLLANIGGFFETPMGYSLHVPEEPLPKIPETQDTHSQTQSIALTQNEEVIPETPSLEFRDQIIETSNMKKPYQNLFDMPVQNKRLKHNLFD